MGQRRKTRSQEGISAAPVEPEPIGTSVSVCQRLFQPVSIAPLVYFRVIFGLLSVALIAVFFSSGMIKQVYIDPTIHFQYYGFGWLRPWPENGMYWHFAALGLFAFCIAIGFCYRAAAFLFGLGFAYAFFIEQARYLNHYYLTFLLSFLLCTMPAHRAFSVDVWLRPKLRSLTAPQWTVWLLMFQLGVVYFFAGVAKLDADWLSGATMSYLMWNKTDLPLIGPFIHEKWVLLTMAYGGMAFDLLVAPLLLFKKTRWYAFIACSLFHLTNVFTFTIDVFPWLMLSGTFVLFFRDLLPFPKPAEVKRETPPLETSAVGEPGLSMAQKLAAIGLLLYVTIQIVLPLQPFFYKGNTNWNQAGHRYSWRMLLRQKYGLKPTFVASFLDKGEKKRIEIPLPSDFLKSEKQKNRFWSVHWQFRKMIQSPDMIWQFCHKHKVHYDELGLTDIEIHAFVPVSLNGRKPQYLIDPTVNLAAVPRPFLGVPEWVLPLEVADATPMWEKETEATPDSN